MGHVLARQVLITTSIVALVVLLLAFLWQTIYIVLLLFAGILLSTLLRSAADGVEKLTGFSENVSLIFALFVAVLVLGSAAFYIAPEVADQVEELSVQIPLALATVTEQLQQYRFGQWLLFETPDLQEFQSLAPEVLARATGVVSTTAAFLIGTVIVLFIGFYLSVNPKLYLRGILRLVPLKERARASLVLAALGYTLKRWLLGQLIIMSAVGVMTAVGLWILGVPLALTLGLLAFALDFVPNFGPIIASIPGILLGLVESPQKALQVTLLYIVIQQVESYIISPYVHKKTVLIPPVVTISSQLLLAVMVGPIGLLLATPITAMAIVLVKMLYIQDVLGDSIDTPDNHFYHDAKPEMPEKYEDQDGSENVHQEVEESKKPIDREIDQGEKHIQ